MNWQNPEYDTMFDHVFEALDYARAQMLEGVLAVHDSCEQEFQVYRNQEASVSKELEQCQSQRQQLSSKMLASFTNGEQLRSKNKQLRQMMVEKQRQIATSKELCSDHLPHVIAEQQVEIYKTQKELAQFMILSQLDLYTGRKQTR